jgi:hypothetical protein
VYLINSISIIKILLDFVAKVGTEDIFTELVTIVESSKC